MINYKQDLRPSGKILYRPRREV